MFGAYLLESGAPDRYQIEDASGVYLLDTFETFSTTLGTATDTGSITPPTGWDSGRSLSVSIPEIASGNNSVVHIALRNMTGAAGLVILHAGGEMPDWYDNGVGLAHVNSLVSDGYRVIQIKGISNYWMTAPLGSNLGSVIVAKRVATLLKYLHDTYSNALPYVVIAGSAGSSGLAYSLVFLNQASIIDHAVHIGSVPHADLFRSCARAHGDNQYWAGDAAAANNVDMSHGYAGDNTGPCYIGDASVEGARWGATSLVGQPVSAYQWSGTVVDVLVGSDDSFMPHALLYHDQLTTATQPHRLGQIPNTPHVIKDTDKGGQTILAAVRRKPYIGAWGENRAEDVTSVTVTLDEAPKSGERIVAVRRWAGGQANGLTPSGWTRLQTATTGGASPLTVAIETRVSDGTEGESLSFTSTSATTLDVAVAVIANSAGSVVAHGTTATSTGTSLTLTTSSVPADTITFSGIVAEATQDNVMNQTWTNDHDQFGVGLDNFSSAYAIHSTSGVKTTQETWTESVDAAGVTTTFSVPIAHEQNQSDDVGLSDSATVDLVVASDDWVVSEADALALSDSAALVQGHEAPAVDGLTLSDAVVVGMTQQVAATDDVALADSAQVAQTHLHAVADALGLTDSATAELFKNTLADDQLPLADSATAVLGHGHVATDSVALSDVGAVGQGHSMLPTDQTGLSDSVSVTLSGSQGITESDQLGLTDTAVVALASAVRPTDEMVLGDAASVSIELVGVAQDSLSLSDATTMQQGHGRSTADVIGLTDSAVVSRGLAANSTDQLGLDDIVAIAMGYSHPVFDTLGLSDAFQAQLSATQSVAAQDMLGLDDLATITLFRLIAQGGVDTMGLSDTSTLTIDSALAVLDEMGLVDTSLLELSGALSVQDALTLADAAAVGMVTPYAYVDVMALSDSVNVALIGAYSPALDPHAEWVDSDVSAGSIDDNTSNADWAGGGSSGTWTNR